MTTISLAVDGINKTIKNSKILNLTFNLNFIKNFVLITCCCPQAHLAICLCLLLLTLSPACAWKRVPLSLTAIYL
ncbi:hypothetical protein JTE90_010940 [Oedothorax gibbosus]|uniref:Uncharacterized protein n=1 Tax=Oedothorax gibbosus TaxID=931172 RepID=A0AAV6U9E8_9ARAC|nr:hypothetical protein JTE90_010940 [Oedothorax gibbosus]